MKSKINKKSRLTSTGHSNHLRHLSKSEIVNNLRKICKKNDDYNKVYEYFFSRLYICTLFELKKYILFISVKEL